MYPHDLPGSGPADSFFGLGIQPGLVLLTGPSGAGKTRWCMDLAARARRAGLRPRGLVSPAVFEAGSKTGIDLLDLDSGERRRLALRRGDAAGDLVTSDWQMLPASLDWGNAVLKSIGLCDLFILDELGPLEFDRGAGLTAGLGLVDSYPSMPMFVVVRPALIPRACERWPRAQVLDLAEARP